MSSEKQIALLTQEVERLTKLLTNADELRADLQKYASSFGLEIKNNINTADQAAEVMKKIIEAAAKQDELTQNQKNSLINVQQLLNNNLKIGNQQVKLDKDHQAILKQIVKHRAEDYGYLLNSNIAEGKRLNIAQQIRNQKEQISKLSKSDAAYALAGMISNNTLLNTFKTLLTTFSSMSAELNKMTLDGDRYAMVAMSSADALAGVSYAESLSAQKELIQGMSTFTRMTEDAQRALVTTTAQFEKLGISAKNQAAMNQMATKSFGMSAKEASNFYSELVTFSKSAGVPMAEIDKNLGAIGNKLALFGREKYQQVFKDLTVAAKDFGIEASKMLEVTERFTTFEGAAQAAGRLNAILGGNFVSGLRLMNSALEDPIDVFRQLKTAMDMSGKEFANMSQAQKRYIAEKIGVSITEAENLFGNSLNESTQRLQERQATQKELAELSEKSTQVFQRLQIALLKIANSPITEMFVSLIEKIAGVIEAVAKFDKKHLGGLLGTVLGLAGGFSLVANGLLIFVNFIKSGYTAIGLFLKALGLKKAAQVADTATAPATVLTENAKTASLQRHTMALELNSKAIGRNVAAQKAMKAASIATTGATAGFRASLVASAPYILGAVAAIAALGAAAYFVMKQYAEVNKHQADYAKYQLETVKAQTTQAEKFKEMATLMGSMTGVEMVLNSFAEGFRAIAESLDLINIETLKELNLLSSKPLQIGMTTTGTSTVRTEVVPVKVVEVEMQTTREEERQQMSLANRVRNQSGEVKLVIDSPISLDGANWGRLISNGIAMYQSKLDPSREITPDLSLYSGRDILRGGGQ